MKKIQVIFGIVVAALLIAGLGGVLHSKRVLADDPVAGPYQIHEISDCSQLQAMTDDLTGRYALANDIDCSDTIHWNGGSGFNPIGYTPDGENYNLFNGELDGHGHTISGLYMDRSAKPADGSTGLIANMNYDGKDSLRNFKLSGATIISGQQFTGGVVGFTNSTQLDRIQFDGTIIVGCTDDTSYIGGLVGYGTVTSITKSSATGGILGARDVCTEDHDLVTGGLTGLLNSSSKIENSYSMMDLTVNVSDTIHSFNYIGGLAGITNSTQIISSYAGGNISIGIDNPDHDYGYNVGGIVGGLQSDSPGFFVDVFAQTAISIPVCNADCGDSSRYQGGILGYDGPSADLSATYYDQMVSGETTCEGTGINTTCNAIDTSGDPDATYFDNNSANPPLDQWDFTKIWETTSGLPVLRDTDPNPGQPTDLAATINSATSINITWTPPTDTGDDVQVDFYEIIYRKVGDNSWTEIDGNQNPAYDLNNLVPGTAYEIKVAAVLDLQYYGPASEAVQATTATPGFYLINDCQDLQAINGDLAGNYELARDIDCGDSSTGNNTAEWNGGAGFLPIGDFESESLVPFVGILAGNNYTISNLVADQELGGSFVNGLFMGTSGALIQDLRLDNFQMTGGAYKGTLAAADFASTITNVQITNALLDGAALNVGGMVGYEVPRGFGGENSAAATQSRNSFSGVIHNEAGPPSSNGSGVGGMYGVVLGSNAGGITITNNYVDAIIIDDYDSQAMGQFIGWLEADTTIGHDLALTNNYAAGELTKATHDPDSEEVMGGILGFISGHGDDGGQLDVSNNFAHVSITDVGDNPIIGGLTAVTDNLGNVSVTGFDSSYFDADLAGTTACAVSTDLTGVCNAISGQPNYFYNNHINPPLDAWDFDHVWETTSTLPVFSGGSLSSITPIPAERLNPPATGGQGGGAPVPAATTEDIKPVYGPLANGLVGSTPEPPSEGGIIGVLKRLLSHVPTGVIVSFPYVLFGSVLVGAGAMAVEMLRQARRLKEINQLIAKQKSIAEQRDTFWHLAANYLRAPITLLMGGVELLGVPETAQSLGAAVAAKAQVTTKELPKVTITAITDLVTSMQSKIAQIMEQIEQSESLQGIQWPKLQSGRKLIRSLRFWLPMGLVALLAVFANYVAHSFRHINASFIAYASQIMIFILVSFIIYWAANGLGLAKRKRERAEKVLAQQTSALDAARMALISKTAEVLDGDISELDSLLNGLPDQQPAGPILHEGARRLRQMVDSFKLLILAQNHKLSQLSSTKASTSLKKVVQNSLDELQTEITAKELTITQPSFGKREVPGSETVLTQVVSSVLANAVDFSPQGGTIELGVQDTPTHTFISIVDHGPGVTKDQEAHIFQLFTKADGQDALQLDHGGLGINLYLDREIMDYLSGEIAVISDEGHGTTVTIRWPKANAVKQGKAIKLSEVNTEYAI